MEIKDIYKLYKRSYLVDTDTRGIRKGSIYFALKGANFNGNKFAQEALNLGASFSIVDEGKYAVSDRIILVDNVLDTLQALSSFHRKEIGVKIIAITGSNGKTTTKELIDTVLKTKYKVVATKGNLNNHIGVPLTLLSIALGTELAIVEMGANHCKEIEFLSNIVCPDYGYITNFGKAHIEGFGSLKGVVEAKSELYTHLIAGNKTIFVNPNDEIQVNKTINANCISFEGSIKYIPTNYFLKVSYDGYDIQTKLIGKYNFTNVLAAITIGKFFGVSSLKIKASLELYTSDNNRSQIIEKGSNSIVLDAYNANPSSMKVAIENFNRITDKRNKLLILGDMFELGAISNKEHQDIVDLLEFFNFERVYLIGSYFYNTNTNFQKFKTFNNFKESIIDDENIENSFILIKGSRGMALERSLELF